VLQSISRCNCCRKASSPLQQLRQLGDIGRDPSRLILRERFGRRSASPAIAKIDENSKSSGMALSRDVPIIEPKDDHGFSAAFEYIIK
jgi:hypothetical protein